MKLSRSTMARAGAKARSPLPQGSGVSLDWWMRNGGETTVELMNLEDSTHPTLKKVRGTESITLRLGGVRLP